MSNLPNGLKLGDKVRIQGQERLGVCTIVTDAFDTSSGNGMVVKTEKEGWTIKDQNHENVRSAIKTQYKDAKPTDRYYFIHDYEFARMNKLKTQFKNDVTVRGTKSLIEAFKQEAIALGWNFQADKDNGNVLVFNALQLKPGAFWHLPADNSGSVGTEYSLPSQWDAAIAAISETEFIDDISPITISGHVAEVSGGRIHFGCQSFTKAQLESYMELLSRSQFTTKLTINGIDITIDTLDRLLTMIKQSK